MWTVNSTLSWGLIICPIAIAYSMGQCTQVSHRQAPASSERRCSCRQQHAKVRPRTVRVTVWRTALVGYTAASRLQALRATVHRCLQCKAPPYTWRISAHRSPISPVGSIYVPLAATSLSFHATVARSSAVGPSLLRVRWPEIRLCQPALLASSEDSSFLFLLAYQRIRGFAFMRYIKSTIDWLIDWLTDYKIGLRLSVCPSASTLTVAFLDRFSPKLAQT